MSQGGGGMGVLLQKIFGWNGVKSYNFNMEIALSYIKPGIVCMPGEGTTLLKLEVIGIFQILTHYV